MLVMYVFNQSISNFNTGPVFGAVLSVREGTEENASTGPVLKGSSVLKEMTNTP